MRARQHLPLLSVVAAAALPCQDARADDLVSTAVLAQGRWRVEAGLDAAPRDATPRQAPLHLGFGGSFALHADHGGLTLESTDITPASPDDAADADLFSGARWHLHAGNAGGFAGTPWLAGAGTPSAGWRSAGSRPSARATAEWSLPRDFSFGVTPGLLLDRDDDGKRHAAGVLALALGKTWSANWRGLVGLTGKAAGGDVPLTLDAGLAYRATDALQFDFSLSHGVAGGAPDVQAGIGLSSRF